MRHYEKQWAAYTLSKERAPVARPGAVPDTPDNVNRRQMQQADKTMDHANARSGSDDQPITLTVTFSSRAELIRALSNNPLLTPDHHLLATFVHVASAAFMTAAVAATSWRRKQSSFSAVSGPTPHPLEARLKEGNIRFCAAIPI
ncbi:hypothetical protein DFQ26_001636, partial [Actinomortierella ambigua]